MDRVGAVSSRKSNLDVEMGRGRVLGMAGGREGFANVFDFWVAFGSTEELDVDVDVPLLGSWSGRRGASRSSLSDAPGLCLFGTDTSPFDGRGNETLARLLGVAKSLLLVPEKEEDGGGILEGGMVDSILCTSSSAFLCALFCACAF